MFLCIGNSCRSQMAEGFARAYGSDVLEARSAGLAAALSIAPLTRKVMLEKNIDLADAFPKGFSVAAADGVDLIVNMSRHKLPANVAKPVEEWVLQDPIGQSEETYREVRDQIEQRVMRLILSIRARGEEPGARGARVDTRRRGPGQ